MQNSLNAQFLITLLSGKCGGEYAVLYCTKRSLLNNVSEMYFSHAKHCEEYCCASIINHTLMKHHWQIPLSHFNRIWGVSWSATTRCAQSWPKRGKSRRWGWRAQSPWRTARPRKAQTRDAQSRGRDRQSGSSSRRRLPKSKLEVRNKCLQLTSSHECIYREFGAEWIWIYKAFRSQEY